MSPTRGNVELVFAPRDHVAIRFAHRQASKKG